jgi:hypothetical protein
MNRVFVMGLIVLAVSTSPIIAYAQQNSGLFGQIINQANQPKRSMSTLKVTSSPSQEDQIRAFNLKLQRENDAQQQQWEQQFNQTLSSTDYTSDSVQIGQILDDAQQAATEQGINNAADATGNAVGNAVNGLFGGGSNGSGQGASGADGGQNIGGANPDQAITNPTAPAVQKPKRPTIYNKYKKQEDKVPPKLFRDYDAQ